MSETSGGHLVAEAIARRLQTPRGRLIDDPNYGFDLTGSLNDDLSQADIARISASVQGECQKDERVLSASVQASFVTGALIVSILLSLASGPFRLVLAVTAVSVQILQVSSAGSS